jgi:uncharacterized membrane protein YfcA
LPAPGSQVGKVASLSEDALALADASEDMSGERLEGKADGASTSSKPEIEPNPHWASLLAVGVVAGLSSGFLGIGGGLATTVGHTVALQVPQHQAQMISLALSLISTTALSAWVYWRDDWVTSWPILIAVILGLQFGTDIGARIATRLSSQTLKNTTIILVASMTAYMAYMALTQ